MKINDSSSLPLDNLIWNIISVSILWLTFRLESLRAVWYSHVKVESSSKTNLKNCSTVHGKTSYNNHDVKYLVELKITGQQLLTLYILVRTSSLMNGWKFLGLVTMSSEVFDSLSLPLTPQLQVFGADCFSFTEPSNAGSSFISAGNPRCCLSFLK